MRYRVYLWLRRSSQAAEFVQEVQAVSAEAAVQVMMRSHALSFVFYAWVVPERETLPCVDYYQVRCASVEAKRQ